MSNELEKAVTKINVVVDDVFTPSQMRKACQDLGEQVIYALVDVMLNSKSDAARVKAASLIAKYGYGDGMKTEDDGGGVLDSMSPAEQLEAAKAVVADLEKKLLEETIGPED